MAESAGTYTIQIVGLTDDAVRSLDRVNAKVKETSAEVGNTNRAAFDLKKAFSLLTMPLAIFASLQRLTSVIVESAESVNVLKKNLNDLSNTFSANVTKIGRDSKASSDERIAAVRAESAAALTAIEKQAEAERQRFEDQFAYRRIINTMNGTTRADVFGAIKKETDLIKEREQAAIQAIRNEDAAAKARKKQADDAAAAQEAIDKSHEEEVAQEARDDAEWSRRQQKMAEFEEFVAKDKLQKRLDKEKEITKEHERQLELLKQQASTLSQMNFSGLGRGAGESVSLARRHLQGRR